MKNNQPSKPATKADKPQSALKKAARKTTVPKSTEKKAAPAKAIKAASKKATKVAAAKAVTSPAVKPKKSATATKTKSAQTTTAGKKPTPSVTTFVAQAEIGWGNSLYIRGEGAPELSWERGILMKWEDDAWVYTTTGARTPVAFKFLVNDHTWAEGHNQHVEPGCTSITTPHFHH